MTILTNVSAKNFTATINANTISQERIIILDLDNI